jgi:hypothetical protein
MADFSPATISYLTKAGWYAGRKVSFIKYRAYLAGEGYSWFPKVATFLEEYGDLQILFRREDGKLDALNFDACAAGAVFDLLWIKENYAQRIGRTNFCVIGKAYSSHLILFMDESGQVYGCFDDYLCFIASSGVEAITVICSNQPVREIPEIDSSK